MALDITWNNVIRTRTRLLAGSAPDEVDIDTFNISPYSLFSIQTKPMEIKLVFLEYL